MGVCVTKGLNTNLSLEDLKAKIVLSIEHDRFSYFEKLWKNCIKPRPEQQSSFHIDDTITTIQNTEINALAFAIRLGRTSIVKFLIENCGASLETVSNILDSVGRSPIELMCEYGHIDLLTYYLPIYLERPLENSEISFQDNESREDLTIFNSKEVKPVKFRGLSAIQRACERGHVEVIDFLSKYFKNKSTPNEFNPHLEVESTGENCALVACRNGNVALAKILHEKCNANFLKLNKRNENGLQLAVASSNRSHYKKYLELIKWLIDVVEIDITFHYEETLLIAQNRVIITFLEEKLLEKGILNAKKLQIDEENTIKSNYQGSLSSLPPDIIDKLRTCGKTFEFSSIFKDIIEERSQSYISSISKQSQSIEISRFNQ